MHGALRGGDRHALAVLGPGLLVALTLGLVAGRWPVIAAAAAAALAVAVAMLKDLAVGIVVFTVASFAAVLSLGGAATGAKGIGFLLVLAWLATIAGRPAREIRRLLRDQRWLVVCAVGLLVWSLLSVAWAHSPKTALVGAGRYAQDLALFPIVYTGVRRLEHVRWVAAAFVVGALVFTLYGAVEGSTGDGSRLAGALGDPNFTAAAMVAAAVLAFGLGAGERRSGPRRWAAFGAATLALLGLGATASRGGLVALGVTGVVMILVAGRWRRQCVLAAAVGSLLVVGWFVLLAPSAARQHISTTQTPRTTLWTVAGRAIEANPIVGLGNDNFTSSAVNYLIAPGTTTRADQIVTTPQPAHNVYLEIWADLGIVGLILFGGVVLAALRAALSAAASLQAAGRRGDEFLARALIVAIVALLAAEFFVSDEYSKQLWLLLALAPATLAVARARTSSHPPVADARADADGEHLLVKGGGAP
jgi:O-antigen ligase